MKFYCAAIILVLLMLLACSRQGATSQSTHDSRLSNDLIGTWVQEIGSKEVVLTVAPNGTFRSGYTNVATSQLVYEGTWKISDGSIITEIQKRTSQNLSNVAAVGSIDRVKIVHADRNEMLVVSENLTNKWTRRE